MQRLLILFLLLIAAPAAAQFDQIGGGPMRGNAIEPELVVDSRAVPGGESDVAILMNTKPGWHGYWLNPGDAGLPLQIEWHLPPGWSVGPLRYPVPTKLLVSGIVNFVYQKDYAVLTRLKVPAGASGTQKIGATMHWLACSRSRPPAVRRPTRASTSGARRCRGRLQAWRTSSARATCSGSASRCRPALASLTLFSSRPPKA